MAGEPNVTRGDQLVLLIRDDNDTVYELAGGVSERGYNIDAPTEEVTSSSSTLGYTERQFTGYRSVSFNVSGFADKRTGVVDTATGLNIVGASRVMELMTSENACGKLKLLNIETNGYIEGIFAISNYSKTGSTPGVINFSCTFESQADITISGDV